MPDLDLDPRYRQIALAIVRGRMPVGNVVAFGSRVSGTNRPASDLDLMLFPPERLSALTIGALLEDFMESSLPMHVDVVDGSAADPAFVRAALATSVRLD